MYQHLPFSLLSPLSFLSPLSWVLFSSLLPPVPLWRHIDSACCGSSRAVRKTLCPPHASSQSSCVPSRPPLFSMFSVVYSLLDCTLLVKRARKAEGVIWGMCSCSRAWAIQASQSPAYMEGFHFLVVLFYNNENPIDTTSVKRDILRSDLLIVEITF